MKSTVQEGGRVCAGTSVEEECLQRNGACPSHRYGASPWKPQAQVGKSRTHPHTGLQQVPRLDVVEWWMVMRRSEDGAGMDRQG